jgi:hypothetical protein
MSNEDVQKNKRHKYMIIETETRDGENIVKIRISKRHPDLPCDCEDPDFDGEDIHDDLRMTLKLALIRVTDEVGILEHSTMRPVEKL